MKFEIIKTWIIEGLKEVKNKVGGIKEVFKTTKEKDWININEIKSFKKQREIFNKIRVK